MTLRGERLDKPSYAILRSLKGGRSGDVYEVDHKVFGRRCVQKTYSTAGLEDARAHREPRLLHAIDHPHVVEVLEAQYDPEVENAITFVAVFYEGGSIADAFEQDYRFSISQSISLVTQALDALAYVHANHKVIHRDVKPGNIFLDSSRTYARLGDFGSAAVVDLDRTVAGIEGSPLYVAPEGGPVGGRMSTAADVYGAAMTAFEMLNGPFDYAAINPAVVDRRLTSGKRALPEAAFDFQPHVPPQLRRVIRKGLRVRPSDRYQSASEFIAALRRVECIDWADVEGDGTNGTWEGSWPPHLPGELRRRYRVRSYLLEGGPDRGRRRLEAYQASSAKAKFARFGVSDETVGADDRDAIDRFFVAVEAKAAQRAPAR